MSVMNVILKQLRCFVVILPSSRFTRFLGVKFWPQKLRSCKKFDKYHVWFSVYWAICATGQCFPFFQFIHPSCAGGCCRQSWEKTDVTCYHPPSRVRTTSCSTSRTKLVAKKTTNKGKKFKWKSWMGSSVFLIVCCCVVLMRYQWCWKWQLLGVIGLACSNNIFRVHDN